MPRNGPRVSYFCQTAAGHERVTPTSNFEHY
jgi:hypothetical protein